MRALRLTALALPLLACASPPSHAPAPPPALAPSPALASSPSPPLDSPPADMPPPACEAFPDLGDIATVDADPPVPDVEDPTGEGMQRFYEKLARLVRGKASDHVRIAMYGDSNLVTDFVTGAMRRDFQKRFGDGGHGWIDAIKPWNSYVHEDVLHGNRADAWVTYTISNNAAYDGAHGFGLIAGESRWPNASTWFQTADEKAPIGKSISRVEVFYLKHPGYGSFDIAVDGETKKTVDTSAPAFAAAFEKIEVPDGPHKVTLTATLPKPVRLFGVTLEREKPSVVVDAIGAVSLTVQQMATKNDYVRA